MEGAPYVPPRLVRVGVQVRVVTVRERDKVESANEALVLRCKPLVVRLSTKTKCTAPTYVWSHFLSLMSRHPVASPRHPSADFAASGSIISPTAITHTFGGPPSGMGCDSIDCRRQSLSWDQSQRHRRIRKHGEHQFAHDLVAMGRCRQYVLCLCIGCI
jgi:hypothetical protein